MTWTPIPRRTVLRGAIHGLAIGLGLPLLEGMGNRLMAAEPGPAGRQEPGAAGRKDPVRFVALFFPNGVPHQDWTPAAAGPLTQLPPILAPLAAHSADMQVISNTWHKACNQGDGHYYKDAAWLTGTTITKTVGADINVGGISLDQLLAQQIGDNTRLPSLELGTEPPRAGVDNNVGITQVYGGHISWSSPTTPVAREIDPKSAFDRLFKLRDQAKAPGQKGPVDLSIDDDISLLDVLKGDAQAMRNRLGQNDQRKLDEYLQSVRDLERRMTKEVNEARKPRRIDPLAVKSLPLLEKQARLHQGRGDRNADHTARCRLMLDILTMALWTDQTRVASFMFGISVSGRNFSFLEGVNGGHHDMSHHDHDAGKLAAYSKISTWHSEQLAYFLERLSKIKEGGKRLLDNCAVLYGSGLGDGNTHSPRNLPIILAGRGGGAFVPGRHIACKDGTPLANVFVEILKATGSKATTFADATGGMPELGKG